MSPRLSGTEWAFLFLAMIAMAAQCLPWIPHLGMEYDEAFQLPETARIVARSPEAALLPAGVTIDGRPFRFTASAYVGSLPGWLMAIPVSLFGFSHTIPRYFNLLTGFVVLWLTYLLARRYGGAVAAGLAVAMLLVDLEFLLHVPVHYGPFLIQMICAAGFLFFLDKWMDHGRPLYFYGACFLAGLGFLEKLTFAWILSLLVFYLLLFRGKSIFERITMKQIAIGCGVFLIAVLPVLWYATAYPEVVFGFGRSATASNVTLDTVLTRFHSFHVLLTGQDFMRQQVADVPGVSRFSALEWLTWAAIVLAAVQRNWKSLMLLLFAVSLVLLNALFPDAGRLHHVLLVYPMLQVGVALAFARWRWSAAIAAILLLATGASTVRNIDWYTKEVRRTGGQNHWSSAIFDAAEWMRNHPEKHFLTPAWGFYNPLLFLTGGRGSVRELYYHLLGDPVSAESKATLVELLHRRESYWITSTILPVYSQNLEKLFAIAKEERLAPKLVREFNRKSGEPIFQVYSFHFDPVAAWRRVPGTFTGTAELQVPLPPGTTDVRFRLNGGKWEGGEALRVELAREDGKPYSVWWRSLIYRPPVWSDQYFEFGDDLFADDFVPLDGTGKGTEARFLRIMAQTKGKPIDLTIADLAVR